VKKFVVGGIEKAVGMRQSASPLFVQLIARLEGGYINNQPGQVIAGGGGTYVFTLDSLSRSNGSINSFPSF
jgi:hypothetical protein